MIVNELMELLTLALEATLGVEEGHWYEAAGGHYIADGGRFGIVYRKGDTWVGMWRTPIRHTELGAEHAWYGPAQWASLDEAKAWVVMWKMSDPEFAYVRRDEQSDER